MSNHATPPNAKQIIEEQTSVKVDRGPFQSSFAVGKGDRARAAVSRARDAAAHANNVRELVEEQAVFALTIDGATVRQIQAETGIDRSRVSRILRRHGRDKTGQPIDTGHAFGYNHDAVSAGIRAVWTTDLTPHFATDAAAQAAVNPRGADSMRDISRRLHLLRTRRWDRPLDLEEPRATITLDEEGIEGLASVLDHLSRNEVKQAQVRATLLVRAARRALDDRTPNRPKVDDRELDWSESEILQFQKHTAALHDQMLQSPETARRRTTGRPTPAMVLSQNPGLSTSEILDALPGRNSLDKLDMLCRDSRLQGYGADDNGRWWLAEHSLYVASHLMAERPTPFCLAIMRAAQIHRAEGKTDVENH